MHKFLAIASAGLLIGIFTLGNVAQAEISVDTHGGANVSTGAVQTSADSDASADTNDDSDSDTDSSPAPVDTSSTADIGESFSLSRDQAESVSLDAESAELSADAVVTSDDFSRFATAHIKRDAGIENIEASNRHIAVEYHRSARFLGFIPGSIRATAEVAGDGTVNIDYPWYRFLFSVNDDTDASLQARVREILSGADQSAGFNVHTEAQLIDAIHEALQGSASADASADASAGGGY